MATTRNEDGTSRGYEGFGGLAAELSSQSTPWWPAPNRAREDAPNVVVVLLDDMGFSDVSPFGGEIETPNVAELAENGYRLTNYHTASVCTPARAALLTGLNPHRAGFASVVHSDPGYPGYRFEIGEDVPTIAESFRAGGYATFMVGKWHLTRESIMHDGADKSSWPLQRGFDRYYGSMDGFTTLFQPHRLVRDNSPVVVDEYPEDFYLTDALTDEALGMIKGLRANDPDKPFFLYLAHQAVHAPLQAKPEDIEKYRGLYDSGWDHVRDERFRRQIRDGLFPEGTRCAPPEDSAALGVTPWEELGEDQRALFARYMEVYAAALDSVDQNLGRLVDHLKEIGEYENTIIVFTSDNGGSGEGGEIGTRSYFSQFQHLAGLPEDWDRDVDRDPELVGGPRAFVHYPRGWAYASNTPFRMFKGHTFAGGVNAPLLLSWPAGLPRAEGDDGVRSQYAYVSDVGQTVLDLAGVEKLASRHGLPAQEVDGVPFSDALREATAPTGHREQYAEFAGHRAYFSDRWKLVTEHRPGTPYTDAEWELYDLAADPAETRNLAREHPEKVAELAAEWHEAAWNNTVFPLGDDASLFTVRPATELLLERPVTLYPGTPTLERFRSSKLTKLRSFEVVVRLALGEGDHGVLFAHGDQGGGYSAAIADGEFRFAYNEYGRTHRFAAPLPERGEAEITIAFTALPAFGWAIEARLGDRILGGLERVAQVSGMAPFTGISVGVDRGSPVDWERFEREGAGRFSGALRSVRYVPGAKADYNAEEIRELEQAIERIYD